MVVPVAVPVPPGVVLPMLVSPPSSLLHEVVSRARVVSQNQGRMGLSIQWAEWYPERWALVRQIPRAVHALAEAALGLAFQTVTDNTRPRMATGSIAMGQRPQLATSAASKVPFSGRTRPRRKLCTVVPR